VVVLATSFASPSLRKLVASARGFAYSQNIAPRVITHTQAKQLACSAAQNIKPKSKDSVFLILRG
jgi:hypothetical protein